LRILTFTSLYPNSVQPWSGTFVEHRLTQLVNRHPVEARVMAPVPWFPSRHPAFGRYAQFASVPARERRNGIDIEHPRYPVIPKVGMLAAPGLMAWAVKPAIERMVQGGFDFDLIDAHFFYPDGVAAASLARRFGKPLVITARGTDINTYPQNRSLRKRILWAAQVASAVVTVSDGLREILIYMGVPEDKVVTLENGVDMDFFSPTPRDAAREKLGFHGRTLICVGNLRRIKGHDLVIDAVAAMDDTSLVIIGNGEEAQNLQRQAARLAPERVSFVPAMAQADLRDYYSAADALVLASEREGMPNVVLEAMACGTPVIAANLPGVQRIAGRGPGCQLLGERSARGIQQAVETLFEDYPHHDVIRGQTEAFDWSVTSKGLWQLFNDLVGRRRDLDEVSANAAR
jgi:teichuronic acid biosynthesis glycosyltransferase TuaC